MKGGCFMKKSIKVVGLCCLAILIGISIYVTLPSKTLDFRGTITEIETADKDFVFHISTAETTYIVVANNKTKVSYYHKDDIDVSLNDLKVGDRIEGNYRWLTKNNIAKFITVEYHSQKSNELLDISTEPYSSATLKIVTEKKIYSIQDKVIKYSITNIDDEEHCVAADDDCFSLHMLVDGEWKRVGTKIEQNWNALAKILNPTQTEHREIDLEKYFNLPLEKGTYRLAVEHLVSNAFEIS